MARLVEVTELVLRDGHQSLLATRMATEDMVDACEDIDQAGFWSVECWGGATYDSCIRFLNEDPWERLRAFRRLMPNSRLQMLLRGQNLLGYRHYEDTVVDRFVDRSAENGMDVFRVFDALNDPRNLKRAMDAVRRTGKHAQGTICYTTSPLHTVEKFVELAQRLKDMGSDSICIKDMAALLRPRPAYEIVQGIKEKCGKDTIVHVHVHSTTGVTMVSLMKAIEAGADVVDTSISSLSLGPGHNPTEALVEMLEGTGYTTRLEKDRLLRIKEHFAGVRPRYAAFESKFTGVETEIFDSQIPGGMISNMESQLKQQGAGDRVKEVLEEVPRVRKAAGYPPLVTPSSQIVGTQAVFNVLMGPYKALTGEFADLMLGYYGETIAGRDAAIIEAAAGHSKKGPITCRPADLLKPEWDELREAALGLKGCNGTDEDVLTYAMFPQVAPKFFASRADGPRNVSKAPVAAKPADGPARSADGKGPITGPVTYEIKIGEKSHRVTVQPA
jgi:methylmalonyl-CoA carboxyltransferase 5S subunit